MRRVLRRIAQPITFVLAGLFLFYLLVRLHPVLAPIHGDGHYTWAWARSLAFDRDLRLHNDYLVCGDPWHKINPVGPGLGPQNTWPVGPAYVWAPLIAISRVILPAAAHSVDPSIAGACRGPLTDLAMGSSSLAAVLALGLGYRCAVRWMSRRAALVAVVLIGLASPLRYYATVAPSYSHTISAFAVALFLERWEASFRDGRGLRGWIVLGLLLGFAMATRVQTVVFAIAPLIEWLRDARRARSVRGVVVLIGYGAAFAACALLVFSPQLYAWRLSYGHWFAMPQGSQYVRWSAPKVDATLFSTIGGLLLYSPILYASLAGALLATWYRATRRLGAMLLLLLAISTYVNASVWDYWGSAGYPARRFTEMTFVFVVGAAVLAGAVERCVSRYPRAATTWAFAAVAIVAAIFHGGVASAIPEQASRSEDIAARVARAAAFDVSRAVGNPLLWPASIPFAIRYRVHPRRWDMMNGYTAFYEDWATLVLCEHRVEMFNPMHEDWFVDGLGPVQELGEKGRATTGRRVRMLVPMFRGNAEAVDVRWFGAGAADATVSWNGHRIFQGSVPPTWTTTHMSLAQGNTRDGANEVVIDVGDSRLFISYLELVQTAGTPL